MKLTNLLFASILLFLFSCHRETIWPIGEAVLVNENFSNFSSIEVSDGLQLILTRDSIENVEIEASRNIQQYIIARQRGNKISFKRSDDVEFASRTKVKIYVSLINISHIDASGGSVVSSSNTLASEQMTSNFSGGSQFSAQMRCTNFISTLSGGSALHLSGSTNNFIVTASGGSSFDCYNFAIDNCSCNLSGGSLGNFNSVDELEINASGGSIVSYKNIGTIKSRNLSGGSQINKR